MVQNIQKCFPFVLYQIKFYFFNGTKYLIIFPFILYQKKFVFNGRKYSKIFSFYIIPKNFLFFLMVQNIQ